MENVYPRLWVGSDADYLRIANKEDWSTLRCAKEGPGGHRQVLGYRTLGAPKGPNYLYVQRKDNKRLCSLNLIDSNDPHYISLEMIMTGLKFVKEQLEAGQKVLIACNHGRSRGPSVAFLFLHMIGDLPQPFIQAENVFKTLCPTYAPGLGMRQFARSNWNTLGRIAANEEDQNG